MDINKIRKKLEEKKDYIKKEFHIVEMEYLDHS
jgi:hypothetical protein